MVTGKPLWRFDNPNAAMYAICFKDAIPDVDGAEVSDALKVTYFSISIWCGNFHPLLPTQFYF